MLAKYFRLIGVLLFTVSLNAASKVDTLFVSRDGNDKWSGTLTTPNSRRSDGPLATLAAARDRARKQDHTRDITIFVRAGTYELADTLTFGA